MKALVAKNGQKLASELYKTPCPIVGATMGQHIRHSLDHMEPVVNLCRQEPTNNGELHYDIRERGGTDEYDWDAACARIQNLDALVLHLLQTVDEKQETNGFANEPVHAFFFLAGQDSAEFELSSTLARELGFSVHHAIHHMAMVKIIALNQGGLDRSDLPSDFGRAPSTVQFDLQQQ